MKQKLHLIAIIVLFLSVHSNAQTKVAVETMQAYSNILPNANYWHLNFQNKRLILEALDMGILKSLKLERDTEIDPALLNLNKTSQLGKIEINWSKSRHIPYHAYVELYEMESNLAYRNGLLDIPEIEKDSVKTIWFVTCSIFDQERKAIFKRTILMRIGQTQSLGIGFPIAFPLSSPVNMFTALSKGIAQITPSTADMSYLVASASMLYATDNLWMPYVHKTPRISIDTSKGFISFSIQGNKQLLRTSNAVTQKLNLKDQSNNYPFKVINNAIKAANKNSRNEYYQIYQPLRDVRNNIDFGIESFISFNEKASFEEEGANPIEFLSDTLNKIYYNNFVVGKFTVTENYTLADKWADPNELYNGYDSTEKFDLGTSFKRHYINANKLISGVYKNSKFSILFNYDANLKTIFIDNQIVCIIQGNKLPIQMVLIPNNITDEYLNFLILFSHSELFQMPSLN
jgi:hypothetical protein